MPNNDIILIQEHWLFQSQLHLINELHDNINYVAKGVDINDPLMPISMPRGHGGVAIIWKTEIDHLVQPLNDGSEKIQAAEVKSATGDNLLIICVYLPAKGSKNHELEYQETIDQIYELCQKFQGTHKIIIGGDINEDLNSQITNKRSQYLQDLITELQLSYENTSKTFVNSLGKETSELDYFIHNLKDSEHSRKTVLQELPENTSDHYPIKMCIDFEYSLQHIKKKDEPYNNTKINWDKVDKDWYTTLMRENVNNIIKERENGTVQLDENIIKTCQAMKSSALTTCERKARYKAKPKLKVWTNEIKTAIHKSRLKYKLWKDMGKPSETDNNLLQEKKRAKKDLRKIIRIELAKQRDTEKELIMETKTRDMKLFHKLVRNNRKKGGETTLELNVNGINYSGEENVIDAFYIHFSHLATFSRQDNIDRNYHTLANEDIKAIENIVEGNNVPEIQPEEMTKAIASINKGKSADYHGLTIEHIIHAGEELQELLRSIINDILQHGTVPETLKKGLLTPVFKNKGNRQQATNYRGITVLPVISKIIETIIKFRTTSTVLQVQNKTQRGFTAGSSPMNSALPLEECYRDAKDANKNFTLILLDAKAAFDTVVHSHMMRRAFLAGIDDQHWTIIKNLHEDAESSIKWGGKISIPFKVNQGVRQGGILSTDLYKLYINPLLDRLEHTGLGYKLGNISINNTACADDIALMSDNPQDAQILVNMATDFAFMEGYELQPTKSVMINVQAKGKHPSDPNLKLKMGNNTMPITDKAMHLGIMRTTSLKENMTVNVDENIKKSRRSAYGLFSSGFHGYNGLDIDTMLHLYKIYIQPVLLYGLELILPTGKQLEKLEIAQKRLLKQILSLPNSVADVVVYILTGILPVEAQIHIRALGLFNNITQQSENSMEKVMARRQLTIKPDNSQSWFVNIKLILRKYDLKEAIYYLNNPIRKNIWCSIVKKAVYKLWTGSLLTMVPLYKGLNFLTTTNIETGKPHPLLKMNCYTGNDIARLTVKLKLLTGSYILQTKRIKMYKTDHDSTCMLCMRNEETIEHFILYCDRLENIRNPILNNLVELLEDSNITFVDYSDNEKLQLLLDFTSIVRTRKIPPANACRIEQLTRRLLFQLHIKRHRIIMDSKK